MNEAVVKWAKEGDLDQLSSYLLSGSVHGKPGLPVAEMNRVTKALTRALTDEELFHLGKSLLRRPEYTARWLGVEFAAKGWPEQNEVANLVKAAADDDDWIVREVAAGVFARLLETDFAHFSSLFADWIRGGSINVKRAIALAVKYHSRQQNPKHWKTYLSLIEPLLREESEYIRKNLGPFAIGDGLLPRFPEKTLVACRRWRKSKDAWTRWNCAMVFTAAAARKYRKEAREIVSSLTADPEPMVARAAKRAEKNLAK